MKIENYRLRAASKADYDSIAQVWHSSASLLGVGPAIMPSVAAMRQRLDVEFAADWTATVAERGGEVLGFVAMKQREAVLAELFVAPTSVGQGIGKALLDHAKAAMADGFTLYTRAANAGARRFYEREGLTELRAGVHPRTGDAIVFYGWTNG